MKPVLEWSAPRYGGSEARVLFGTRSTIRLSVTWKEGGKYTVECDAGRGEVRTQGLEDAQLAAEGWLREKLGAALAALGDGRT